MEGVDDGDEQQLRQTAAYLQHRFPRHLLPRLYEHIAPLLRTDVLRLLPTETAYNVLRHLDLGSMAMVMLTSKPWYRLAASFLEYWRQQLARQAGHYESDLSLLGLYTDAEDEPCSSKRPKMSMPMTASMSTLNANTPNATPTPTPTPTSFSSHTMAPSGAHAAALGRINRYRQLDYMWREGEPAVLRIECHEHAVITCVAIVGADRVLTASEDHSIRLWAASDGRLLHVFEGHHGGVWSLSVRDGFLLSGSTDRSLILWHLDSGSLVARLKGHGSTVRCAVLATLNDAANGTATASMAQNLSHLEAPQGASRASNGGVPRHLVAVSGSRDRTLRIWDLATCETRFILSGHTASIRCIAVQGHRVVSGSYDGSARLWDLRTGVCLRLLIGHTGKIYSVDFQGPYIATGGLDSNIHVWDADSGECLAVIEGHRGLVGGLQFQAFPWHLLPISSPPFSVLSSTSNANANTNSSSTSMPQSSSSCQSSYAHSSVSLALLSSNTDGSVRVWSVPYGDPLFRMKPPSTSSAAMTFIKADHLRLVAASDSCVSLFDPRKGFSFVRNLLSGLDTVWRMDFSDSLLAVTCQKSGNSTLFIVKFQ